MAMAMNPAHLLPLGLETGAHVKQPQAGASQDDAQSRSLEVLEAPSQQPAAATAMRPETMPSLSHVTRLLKLQRYQRRRCQRLQSQLHDLQVATARTFRLIAVARSIQRSLAECIRCEDKHSFLSLSNAFQDAVEDCRRLCVDSAEGEWSESETSSASAGSFLDRLPETSRATLIALVTAVRYDGDFVADRLMSLTHKEILCLLPDKGAVRSAESIFGSSSGQYSRDSRQLGCVVDSQTEVLTSQGFTYGLEILVHSVRGLNSGNFTEDGTALDVWSTVCARLLSEQKQGSEKLVPTVIEIWTRLGQWPGKDRLEEWILRTVHRGFFLAEQPSKRSFRMRVEGRPEGRAEEEVRAEAFYARAVGELLDLLGDSQGASVIPDSVLRICRAIWTKMESHPTHQRAFPHFVLTRWLFSSFFTDATLLPEAFGLVPDAYISDIARQRILREVANRAQKAVFDVAYSWRYGHVVSAQTHSRVQAIMCRFQGTQDDTRATSPPLTPHAEQDRTFFTISAADMTKIAKALYPQRRPVPFSSGGDISQSGLLSSSSSISGFSLFRRAGSWESSPYHVSTPSQDPLDAQDTQAGISASSSHDSVHTVRLEERLLPTNLNRDYIWEACASIDNLLDVRAVPWDKWTTLLALPGQRTLLPMSEVICRPEDTDASQSSGEQAAQLAACTSILEHLVSDQQRYEPGNERTTSTELYQSMVKAIERSIRSAEDASDFIDAHRRHQDLHLLQSIYTQDPRLHLMRTALTGVEDRVHESESRIAISVQTCEDWYRIVKPSLESNFAQLSAYLGDAERLRDKMWFVADVRTSAAYDEARCVAGALRIMGKPRRSPQARMAPPLRHWSGTKLSNAGFHLKTEAQVLELLSALPDQGGPNKLGDDQAQSTRVWMERNNVENLCRGEERLHRLCMEIRKCIDQVTLPEGALLSNNPLFARDVPSSRHTHRGVSNVPLSAFQETSESLSHLSLQTNVAQGIDGITGAHKVLSSVSSRDYLESRSPTLTHKSSAPFWSPAITETYSPSSATSIGSYHTQTPYTDPQRTQRVVAKAVDTSVLDRLRRRLTSLLLSDLTWNLFNEGSETDAAFWTDLGGEIVNKHLRAVFAHPSTSGQQAGTDSNVRPLKPPAGFFPYDHAFRRLLKSFSISSDPHGKLATLYDVGRLMSLSAKERRGARPPTGSAVATPTSYPGRTQDTKEDDNVAGFRRLFCDPETRPGAIIRDLQFIAALVPATILESTPQGKAYWNAAVAISQLKRDACNIMVETADSIIAYHTNNRGHGRASSTAQQQRDSATFSTPSRTSSAEEVARYSMADAAYLLQITAKEGDAVAQRELATLYLTHPELMDHIIAPFARPREVFKEELESKWRKNQDPNRCDPATMCVAHHWMSLSSKGGDALAKEYLRQREEMERLP